MICNYIYWAVISLFVHINSSLWMVCHFKIYTYLFFLSWKKVVVWRWERWVKNWTNKWNISVIIVVCVISYSLLICSIFIPTQSANNRAPLFCQYKPLHFLKTHKINEKKNSVGNNICCKLICKTPVTFVGKFLRRCSWYPLWTTLHEN